MTGHDAISGSISHIYLFNFGGDRNQFHVSEYLIFLLWLDQFYWAEVMKCKSQENKNKINFRNFRNLTWSYLNELPWAKWLIYYHLVIWPDLLISWYGWSGWWADFKKNDFFEILKFSLTWSADLICWSGWSADFLDFLLKNWIFWNVMLLYCQSWNIVIWSFRQILNYPEPKYYQLIFPINTWF